MGQESPTFIANRIVYVLTLLQPLKQIPRVFVQNPGHFRHFQPNIYVLYSLPSSALATTAGWSIPSERTCDGIDTSRIRHRYNLPGH